MPVDRIYVMRNLGNAEAREAITVDHEPDLNATYRQAGQSMMRNSCENRASNISIALPLLIDATPSLAEPSNWTSEHHVFQSLTSDHLIDVHSFLSRMEIWRNATFARIGARKLTWVPAEARLKGSIRLSWGQQDIARSTSMQRQSMETHRIKYVQGQMDGEVVPSEFGDDDPLL